MKILSKDEMLNIQGGGISAWGVFIFNTILSFVSGIIDGIARPPMCH